MLERFRAALWRARDTLRDAVRPAHREEVFSRIYTANLWGDAESRSGPGSNAAATANIVRELPDVWARHGIGSLVDAPCGDCHWMSSIAPRLDQYIGIDIVPALIEANRREYPHLAFEHRDLTREVLPKADAIFCRDLFQHLPIRLIFNALNLFRQSGATWVFLTTNENVTTNVDGVIGSSRPLNLRLPPFNMPAPVHSIDDGEPGRQLALWRLKPADLTTRRT